MRLFKNYYFQGVKGVYDADPPNVVTTCYEFDTEEEMNASGLLHDKRRTTCFVSNGKWYIGGHFNPDLTRCDVCDSYDKQKRVCRMKPNDRGWYCPLTPEERKANKI